MQWGIQQSYKLRKSDISALARTLFIAMLLFKPNEVLLVLTIIHILLVVLIELR
jgi:hypothetical protein